MSPDLDQQRGAPSSDPSTPRVPDGLKSICGLGSDRLEKNGETILGAGTLVLDVVIIAALPNPPFLIGAGVAAVLFGLGLAARAPAIKVLRRIEDDPPDPNFERPAKNQKAKFRFKLGVFTGNEEAEVLFSDALDQFSDCTTQLDKLIRSFEKVQGAFLAQQVSKDPEKMAQVARAREGDFTGCLVSAERSLSQFSFSIEEQMIPWLREIDGLVASTQGQLTEKDRSLDRHAAGQLRTALLTSTVPQGVVVDGLAQSDPQGTFSLEDAFTDVSRVYRDLAGGLRDWRAEYESLLG